jgi:hypothetical protein
MPFAKHRCVAKSTVRTTCKAKCALIHRSSGPARKAAQAAELRRQAKQQALDTPQYASTHRRQAKTDRSG